MRFSPIFFIRCKEIINKHGIFKTFFLAFSALKRNGPHLGIKQMLNDIYSTPPKNIPIIIEKIKLPASPAKKIFKAFVLIIATLDLPQCKKYRVLQRAELIDEALGIQCIVSHYLDVARWKSLMQIATSVLFYRVPSGKEFDYAMTEAKRLGLSVSYDIDDPVFDLETVMTNPNIALLSRSIQTALVKDAKLFSEAMSQCDVITVSTKGMQNLIKKRFPKANVYIVPNGLDRETLHYASVINKRARSYDADQPFSILIPSGSHAHGADILVALSGLTEFIKRYPDTLIIEIGHGGIGENIKNIKKYKKFPLLPYSEYLNALSMVSCSLVSLASSEFNECKSIVRFLDAASLGVPVIASCIGEYRDISDANIYLNVNDVHEWTNKLEVMRKYHLQRFDLGAKAKDFVMANKNLAMLSKALSSDLISVYKN